MIENQTPLKIEDITENIYGGFWPRLGSLFLDFIIVVPVGILTLYLNSLDKNAYYFTIIPNLLFGLWYHVYLVKKNGGTPGKLIVGIKIININGQDADWKEAFLRHVVLLGITIIGAVVTIIALSQADSEHYESLGWMQKQQYLMSLTPFLFSVFSWTNNIWIWSEFIVLLTNARRRAIHDYVGGTVVIKEKFLEKIRATMNPEIPR